MSKIHTPKALLDHLNKKRLILLLAGLLLVITLLLVLVLLKPKPKTTLKTYGGQGPSQGTYEVIGKKKDGSTTRVSVVTSVTKDEDLITLNDTLYAKYKDLGLLFIDYFDDKEAAQDYFSEISAPDTSNDQKKELVRHYKAIMMASGLQAKTLYRIGNNAKALKTY